MAVTEGGFGWLLSFAIWIPRRSTSVCAIHSILNAPALLPSVPMLRSFTSQLTSRQSQEAFLDNSFTRFVQYVQADIINIILSRCMSALVALKQNSKTLAQVPGPFPLPPPSCSPYPISCHPHLGPTLTSPSREGKPRDVPGASDSSALPLLTSTWIYHPD